MRYGKMYLNGKNKVKFVDLFGIELGNDFIDDSEDFKNHTIETLIRLIPDGIFIKSAELTDTFIIGQVTKVNEDHTVNVRLVYSNLIVNEVVNKYTDSIKSGTLKGLLKYDLGEDKKVENISSLILYNDYEEVRKIS